MKTSRQILVQARRRAGRTVAEVAQILGCNRHTTYRLERGAGVQGRIVLRVPEAYGLTEMEAGRWLVAAAADERRSRAERGPDSFDPDETGVPHG